MKAVYKFGIEIKIRLGQLLSLIFFALFFLPGCKQNKKEEITILWKNKHASGIAIPKTLLREVDSTQLLQIRLENK